MVSSKNRDLLAAAFLRFGRAALAAVLAFVIPQLLDLIPQLELGPELKGFATLFLVPALMAVDKFARGKNWY